MTADVARRSHVTKQGQSYVLSTPRDTYCFVNAALVATRHSSIIRE